MAFKSSNIALMVEIFFESRIAVGTELYFLIKKKKQVYVSFFRLGLLSKYSSELRSA